MSRPDANLFFVCDNNIHLHYEIKRARYGAGPGRLKINLAVKLVLFNLEQCSISIYSVLWYVISLQPFNKDHREHQKMSKQTFYSLKIEYEHKTKHAVVEH